MLWVTEKFGRFAETPATVATDTTGVWAKFERAIDSIRIEVFHCRRVLNRCYKNVIFLRQLYIL